MANYSYNTLAIKGSKENIVKFFNAGLKKNKQVFTFAELSILLGNKDEKNKPFHMSSWKPIPRTFIQWDTSNDKQDILYWLMSGGKVKGTNKPVFRFLKKYVAEKMATFGPSLITIKDTWDDKQHYIFKDKEVQTELIKQFQPDYNKYCEEYDKAVVYQKIKYDVVGWYDFNTNVWFGTKWDTTFYDWEIQDMGDGAIVYGKFDTAWCIPTLWLNTIQEKFGDLVSFYFYAQEEGNVYLGYFPLTSNTFTEEISGCWEEYAQQIENEGKYQKNEDGYFPDEFYDEVRGLFDAKRDELYNNFLTFVQEN